jgi:hypothetical protein
MEKESVTYQAAATFTCPEPCFFNIHYNINFPFTLTPPSGLLASGFRTKSLQEFLFSAMHSTSAANLILHLSH